MSTTTIATSTISPELVYGASVRLASFDSPWNNA